MRLAGPDAPRIAQQLTGRDAPFEPRHATFTRVIDRADDARRAVDHVVVTWFAAPHSYTGDDVIELSAHGSPVLLQRIVELAMTAGARLAEPGEFTLRAYLNGRLDLIQAEAVADLVDAVTPLQARAAVDQLEGTLTSAIARIDAALFDLGAKLEASLDFPDEGFHFITRGEVVEEIGRIAEDVAALIARGKAGRVVREGRLVVIAGRPNAGKSSLFNALVGASRAIVTEVPGTTRDALTERVDIGGIPVTLVDTAGLRESTDRVEAEGIHRAREALTVAALTVVVIDGAEPLSDDDRRVRDSVQGPRVIVASKSDRPRAWQSCELVAGGELVLDVSAITGAGLDVLRADIVAALVDREDLRDPPPLSNVRHLALVESCAAALERARAALGAGVTEELVLTDLGAARRALEQITGHRTADDLLKHVFERFCIGK